jgi:predicted SAM-dependent methyltransferase
MEYGRVAGDTGHADSGTGAYPTRTPMCMHVACLGSAQPTDTAKGVTSALRYSKDRCYPLAMAPADTSQPSRIPPLRTLLTRARIIGRRLAVGQSETVLQIGYRAILQRLPDSHGRADYGPKLRSGELTVEQFGRRLFESREFEQVSVGKDLGLSLHRSRCAFVRGLPPAERILDLGGTDLGHEWGAMVTMGYPYNFEELVIVDLPPDERHPIYNRGGLRPTVETTRGTVRYAYHSMIDLSSFEDGSFDLVYSGQSIEHVPVDAADTMLEGAFRVLRPGGFMGIDTPNARLTRLQQDELIDPDHTYEYTVKELVDKVSAVGFEVVECKGLNLGRESLARGHFDPMELARNVGIYADADSCYLTAILCRKP